ncbi:MAG: hypothetical protein LOY03_12100 [Cyclobacteriaceae bacterium]|jgi:hypothetical protein|nr:hypothetical protein [Cyclobacteriaceae bacterium]
MNFTNNFLGMNCMSSYREHRGTQYRIPEKYHYRWDSILVGVVARV